MIRKYFIYIVILAVLLLAWNYRASIKDSIDSIVQNVKDVRAASPFTDDRIEGQIKQSMDR